MAEFLVKIGTPIGDIREEVYHATDEQSLRHELEQKDIYVFRMRPRSSLRLAMPRFGKARVKHDQFMVFNQELVTLLRAGLPLLQCFDVLLERMPESALRGALEDVRKRIRAGEALSEAFEAQGSLFPPIYASSLTAGERSGELDTVLERYVDYIKKMRILRRKVGQALIYPAILLGLSISVIGILMVFAIPQFVGLYQDFDAELPMHTQIVIGISNLFINHWIWFVLGIAGLGISARMFLQTEQGLRIWDQRKLQLPFIGQILRKYSISETCRTLSILLRGGIPLVSGLDVTAAAVGNTMIKQHLKDVAVEVRQGKPLWESLEDAGIMTDLALEMTKVGESTGALDVMMLKISEFYDEEIDNRLTVLLTWFEPAMLIVMGVIVAVLLLSMYLPLFQTVSAIKT